MTLEEKLKEIGCETDVFELSLNVEPLIAALRKAEEQRSAWVRLYEHACHKSDKNDGFNADLAIERDDAELLAILGVAIDEDESEGGE